MDVNCAWTIDFGLATPEAMEKMQAYAPDDLQYLLSRPVTVRASDREAVAEAIRTTLEESTAAERWDSRYPKNDIIRLNRTGRVGWLRARVDSGPTQVEGVAPFYWTHSMSRAEWDSYKDRSEHVPFHEMTRIELPEEPVERRAPRVLNHHAGTTAGDERLRQHVRTRGDEDDHGPQ